MKNLLLLACTVISVSVSAQKPKIVDDTLFYNNHRYAVGDTIQLLYGSDPKKNFIVCFWV